MPPDLLVTLLDLRGARVPLGAPLWHVPSSEVPALPRIVHGHSEAGPIVRGLTGDVVASDLAAWAISLAEPAVDEGGDPMWLDLLPWAASIVLRHGPWEHWVELPASSVLEAVLVHRGGTRSQGGMMSIARHGRIVRLVTARSRVPALSLSDIARESIAQALRTGLLRGEIGPYRVPQ